MGRAAHHNKTEKQVAELDGLTEARIAWKAEDDAAKATFNRKSVVGGFGFVFPKNYDCTYLWVLSYGRDGKHGVQQPATPDPYCEDMFASMFKNW